MFFKSSSKDSYVIYSVTYISRSATYTGLHANIGRVCCAYNTWTYGQGTVKTAVRFSTAIKMQRTVSHKATSHVKGQRVFHTGSDKMIFYTVCVNT